MYFYLFYNFYDFLINNFIIKLIKFIKREDINILNIHTGKTQTIAYLISLLCPYIKIVRTKADAKKATESFTYSRVRLIICGSKHIEGMFYKIKQKKVTIYKSVALPEYRDIKKEEPFLIWYPANQGY